jgi:hypothetical protein
VLLTIGGIWESEDDIEFEDNTVVPDLIRCALESSLAKLARARDMSRFDPMSR